MRRKRKELEHEHAAMHRALVAIAALSSEEHVIRAQMLAAKAIGYRYLSSVTVVRPGESPLVVDADGRLLATCPECQKPHTLGPTSSSAPETESPSS